MSKFVINYEFQIPDDFNEQNRQVIAAHIDSLIQNWNDYFGPFACDGFIGFLPEDDNETKD